MPVFDFVIKNRGNRNHRNQGMSVFDFVWFVSKNTDETLENLCSHCARKYVLTIANALYRK